MPATATNQTLLWRCILWVQYEHSQKTVEQQAQRPQRCYQPDDGKRISGLIKKIKQAYYSQKMEPGSLVNFDRCKKEILNTQALDTAWDVSTRNFYSSVISTYFSWSYHGIPQTITVQLEALASFAEYVKKVGNLPKLPYL